MKKIYIRLAASVMTILIALVLVVGSTYAWMTFSASPEGKGMAIVIGGHNAIQLAPDVVATVTDENGQEIPAHYPGEFDDTLVFSQYAAYDYLNRLSGLLPVSTADGIHWVMPQYDAQTGELMEVSRFTLDDSLEYANLSGENSGYYVYLDFWLVSPVADCEVRISMDTKSGTGSYLMEFPRLVVQEDGSFSLEASQRIVESSARVGFLVNDETVTDNEPMLLYSQGENYSGAYTSLKGIYPEKGEQIPDPSRYTFSVYEPNATSHPGIPEEDGRYLLTYPLMVNNQGQIVTSENPLANQAVQQCSLWRTQEGNASVINELFEGYYHLHDEGTTPLQAYEDFCREVLTGRLDSYVACGEFYASTQKLLEAAIASPQVEDLPTQGAADDVTIVRLQANVPQRVRMYIWIEGQDVDCTNTSAVDQTQFSLGIELSGSEGA